MYYQWYGIILHCNNHKVNVTPTYLRHVFCELNSRNRSIQQECKEDSQGK